jgi:hypothetical protein
MIEVPTHEVIERLRDMARYALSRRDAQTCLAAAVARRGRRPWSPGSSQAGKRSGSGM